MLKLIYIDTAAAVGMLYLLAKLTKGQNDKTKPLPPGPSGYPIIGNLFQWPKQKEWQVFTEWAKVYGDLVYVNVAGQPVIIVNSSDVARDILDRRGANYSDRPYLHFAGTMSGYSGVTTLLNDSPAFKEHRKLFAQEIGSKKALARFNSLIEAETKRFVRNILKKPSSEALGNHIRSLSASIILDITYGYQSKDGQDDMVDLAIEAVHNFSVAATPGAHIVDTFPWLERLPGWLPGMEFKRQAKKYQLRLQDFLNVPYNLMLESMVAGTVRPSVVAAYIQKQGVIVDEQQQILKFAAASMYGGGADTSLHTTNGFFLYMVLYPEVQIKAQTELDAFIEEEHRLPTLDDRPRLPYVDALVTEVFRCTCVVRQGVPHQARSDDFYNQYFIPKNCTVIPNIWYMCNNPDVYCNPSIFNPDRYLGESPEPDPRLAVFGYGRRVCPGRLFVENTLFMTCVTSLAVLDISRAHDEAGNEILPEEDWSGGIISEVSKFECIIKPRSAEKVALVEIGA